MTTVSDCKRLKTIFRCRITRAWHSESSYLGIVAFWVFEQTQGTTPTENIQHIFLNQTSWSFPLRPQQVCSTGPLPRVERPSPAGLSTISPSRTPRFLLARWVAPTPRRLIWSTACGARISGSWWTRTSNQLATTLPLALWWTETWCPTIPRSSCSRWMCIRPCERIRNVLLFLHLTLWAANVEMFSCGFGRRNDLENT